MKINFSELDSIKIRALKATICPDSEDFIRKLQRWFCREFYVPLNLVEDFTIEEMLRN